MKKNSEKIHFAFFKTNSPYFTEDPRICNFYIGIHIEDRESKIRHNFYKWEDI